MAKQSFAYLIPLIGFAIFVVIASVALLATVNGTRQNDQLPSVLLGKQAPALPANALSQEFAKPLSAFAGEVVLVNVMASWCAPCRAELPALSLLSKEMPVLAIAYKDKQEDTQKFLEQYGNPYSAIWMDYDGTTGISWGIYGVPETFIIDGDGRVVLRHAGPIFKDTVDNVIRPTVQELRK